MEIHPNEMSQGEKDCEECLTSTISAKLLKGAQKAESLFSSACIYRVPEELRKLNASAYTPRLIAIGPLHRNDEHLQTPMQQVKMSYANHLLCRLAEGSEQKRISLLQKCVTEMKNSVDDAKKFYAEKVTLDVEMMLVDGCFILELLYRKFLITDPDWIISNIGSSHSIVGSDNGYSKETRTAPTELLSVSESRIQVERSRTIEEILGLQTADPIFGNSLTYYAVYHDLLLLENQIPFLVLEKLFPITMGRISIGSNRLSLTGYLVLYFGKKMRPEGNSTEDHVLRDFGNKMENSEPKEEEVPSRPAANHHYHHILHKVHDGYLPPDPTGKNEHYEIMPFATELVYAGVKFVRGNEAGDLFNIEFKKPEGPFWCCRSASFEIPTLVMEDSTESFLRNLIAFEQCCSGIPQHFTSYAILMDMLVDSDKDVQVLEKAGILRNCLGASEDATNLFNKLCKEVVEGEFFFAEICDRAHKYRRSFWPKHIAHVRRQYFASPWRFIAFCLAFCAVGISITQFFRSFSWP